MILVCAYGELQVGSIMSWADPGLEGGGGEAGGRGGGGWREESGGGRGSGPPPTVKFS